MKSDVSSSKVKLFETEVQLIETTPLDSKTNKPLPLTGYREQFTQSNSDHLLIGTLDSLRLSPILYLRINLLI